MATPPALAQSSQGAAPGLVTFPSLTGGQSRGSVLTAGTGTWSPAAQNLSYQWQSCTAAKSNCQVIPGQTSNTHMVTQSDEGRIIEVVVVASNPYGSSTAVVQTGVITDDLPQNAAAPALLNMPSLGVLRAGTVLEATPGTWSGEGNTYRYQWQACNEYATNCDSIPRAVGPSYTTTGSDENVRIRVQVTASNVDGSATAASAATSAGLTPPSRYNATPYCPVSQQKPICAWTQPLLRDPNNLFASSPWEQGQQATSEQCTYWANEKRPDIALNESPSDPAPTQWDAYRWAAHAQLEGLKVSSAPGVGDVAVWPPATPGGPGHVAYVEAVSPGATMIVVSEMNAGFPDGDTRLVDSSALAGVKFIGLPPDSTPPRPAAGIVDWGSEHTVQSGSGAAPSRASRNRSARAGGSGR